MQQVARIVIMAAVGFLKGCCYLVHDRDTKFGSGFERILASAEWIHCVYPGGVLRFCYWRPAWAGNFLGHRTAPTLKRQ